MSDKAKPYAHIPLDVIENFDISASAFRVLARLIVFAGKDNKAFPTQTTLAKATNLSIPQLVRKLKELEQAGLITRTLPPPGKRTPTIYTIHIAGCEKPVNCHKEQMDMAENPTKYEPASEEIAEEIPSKMMGLTPQKRWVNPLKNDGSHPSKMRGRKLPIENNQFKITIEKSLSSLSFRGYRPSSPKTTCIYYKPPQRFLSLISNNINQVYYNNRARDNKQDISYSSKGGYSMKEIITTIREMWDEIAKDHGMIPTRGRLSERREKAIKARWEEVFKGWYGEPPQTIEEGYEWFRWYFLSIASNPFYCGKNDRGWRAGIDYALRPSAMERLVEQAAVPLTTPATDAEIMRQIEEWERRMGISDAVD